MNYSFYTYSAIVNLFNALKADLAVNPSNIKSGSTLGGNPSHLAFLIQNDIHLNAGDIQKSKIYKDDGGKLNFMMPIKWWRDDITTHIKNDEGKYHPHILQDLRKAVTNYIENIEYDQYSFEDLFNLDGETIDLKLLQSAINISKNIGISIIEKYNFYKQIKETIFAKEKNSIIKDYAVEMSLPEIDISKISADQLLEIKMLAEMHHIYGERLKNNSSRLEQIKNNLLSSSEIDTLHDLEQYPYWVTILVCRKLFNINIIMEMNLDNFFNKRSYII